MIACNPQGICSWNYALYGDSLQAEIEVLGFWENGSIRIGREVYEITKTGFFSTTYLLEDGAQTLYQARKPSPFFSDLEIDGPGGVTMLRRESIFGREMRMSGPDCEWIAAPIHPFTRRATIEGRWSDPRLLVFGFWLVVMQWRRQASRRS